MAGLPRGRAARRLGSGGLYVNTGQSSLKGEEALGQSCYTVGVVDRQFVGVTWLDEEGLNRGKGYLSSLLKLVNGTPKGRLYRFCHPRRKVASPLYLVVPIIRATRRRKWDTWIHGSCKIPSGIEPPHWGASTDRSSGFSKLPRGQADQFPSGLFGSEYASRMS
jgi:hypothetical protein